MLDFGFSEILLTSAIALVVLGPERLPKVARQVGNWMGRARAMARQLSEQLEREVSEEEFLKQQRDAKPLMAPQGVPPAAAPNAPNAPAEFSSAPAQPAAAETAAAPAGSAPAMMPLQDSTASHAREAPPVSNAGSVEPAHVVPTKPPHD